MVPQKIISFVMVFALTGGMLMTACASQPTVQTPEAVETATVTPTPDTVLTVFNPESPDTFNVHLSRSIKNLEPARIVYEPLAVYDKDVKMIPVLAAEIPSLENGGLAADGKSVTWKLRQDVRWSDGEPFTAQDVVFTYDYIMDPGVKAKTQFFYALVATVKAVDDFTVKITFKNVNPAWNLPFVGNGGVIIPKHIFEKYKGANAADAPANLMPVGTGPYQVAEPGIKPQEVLLLGSQIVKTTKIVFVPNPNYRSPEKIFFDRILWRGGGTENEAARLLLQVGNLDVVYGIDTADQTQLSELMKNEKGKLISAYGSILLRILVNRTDPNTPSQDGEYSSLQVHHPFFSDKIIRQAVALAINRDAIAQLFGENGRPTYANLIAPSQYVSSSVFYKYDLEKAKTLLDQAGYLDTNGDGFREKNGAKIKLVFQGFADAITQQVQKIVQKDLKAIGIDTELKIIDSSIMFGPATSPDSYINFPADLMIVQLRSQSPDPSGYMGYWTCASIPQKANKYAGFNYERWCNPEYDDLLRLANTELDPARRQEMFIKLNDMLVEDVVMIPIVWRANALGVNQKFAGLDPTPWDSVTWNIQDWRFAEP